MLKMRALALCVALLAIFMMGAAAAAATLPDESPLFADVSVTPEDGGERAMALEVAAPELEEDVPAVGEPVVDDEAVAPAPEAGLDATMDGDQPVIVFGRSRGAKAAGAPMFERAKAPSRPPVPAIGAAVAQALAERTNALGSDAGKAPTGSTQIEALNDTDVLPAALPGVYVSAAATLDSSSVAKTIFTTGSTIKYRATIYNTTGSNQTFTLRYLLRTPCGSTYTFDDDEVDLDNGGWYYTLTRTALCPGRHTLTVSVIYGGRTTSKSVNYTVNGTGTVEVVYADASDEDYDAQTSFAADDIVIYFAQLLNTTNRTKTANLRFVVESPCEPDGYYLRSGDVSVQWGYRWFYYVEYAMCPGSHTLTVYTTYDGSTTSETYEYTVTGSGAVYSYDAWTANASGVAKSTFNAGEPIRWYAELLNTAGSAQAADYQFSDAGPCDTEEFWDDSDSFDPGYTYGYYSGRAACPGEHELTFSVTYGGETTTATYAYNVRGAGSVIADYTDASDTNDDAQTTFNADDTVVYWGKIFNSTASARNVTAAWALSTPCGTRSFGRRTVSADPGDEWVYVEGTASCPGAHTLTFSVTSSGRTTKKTYSYTVTGNGSVVARNAWLADSKGKAKTSVAAGTAIRYYGQAFNSGPTQPFTGTLTLDSPCVDDETLWSGSLNATRGVTTTYYLSRTAACPGAHTLTFSATYSGTTTTATRAYTVTGTGNVTAVSTYTTDESNSYKTSFTAGESVRLWGYAFNSTAADQTVTARWGTRCGNWSTSSSESADTGYDAWYQTVTATCLGKNTLTFSVTYNGKTTSKTFNFTVRAAKPE